MTIVISKISKINFVDTKMLELIPGGENLPLTFDWVPEVKHFNAFVQLSIEYCILWDGANMCSILVSNFPVKKAENSFSFCMMISTD